MKHLEIYIMTHNSQGQGDRMSENAQKVLKAMKEAGKPVRPGDVAKTLGMDSKDVSKAIDALKKEGKISSPKRCFYAPTD
jgi:biotin operon repressor